MNRRDKINKNAFKGVSESILAWGEFFENKPEPKDDEEERKQLGEFYHWYNHIRKQSDTGKTPAEMYKEIYGKEPPANFPSSIDLAESRVLNPEPDEFFSEELDEDDEEDDEIDSAQEEAIVTAGGIFENTWKIIKREVEGASKKESCKYSFIQGFLSYFRIIDEQTDNFRGELQDLSDDELKKVFSRLKEGLEGQKDG